MNWAITGLKFQELNGISVLNGISRIPNVIRSLKLPLKKKFIYVILAVPGLC